MLKKCPKCEKMMPTISMWSFAMPMLPRGFCTLVHSFSFADNFDHSEDRELTLKGFLDLHEITANDEEGGEAELWTIMEAMGYNRQLKLNKVTL